MIRWYTLGPLGALDVERKIGTGKLRRIINDGVKKKLNPLACIGRVTRAPNVVGWTKKKKKVYKKRGETGLIPYTWKCQRDRHFKNKCCRLAFVASYPLVLPQSVPREILSYLRSSVDGAKDQPTRSKIYWVSTDVFIKF